MVSEKALQCIYIVSTSTNPPTIDIIHSARNERSIIAQQEYNNLRNLNRLCTSFLSCDLQSTLHIFWILALRHGGVDRAGRNAINSDLRILLRGCPR